MGARYFITVTCPECGQTDDDVYFAPTCGFTEHRCEGCGHVIDLHALTGLGYEDCSNGEEIKVLCKKIGNDPQGMG